MDMLLKPDSYGIGDISIAGGEPTLDLGLETAVFISLFTDARADGKGGWWGDSGEAYPLGSRLWTLERAKTTQENIQAAKTYVKECLKWLVDEGIAFAVDVDVQRLGMSELRITVEITGPSGASKYTYTWSSMGIGGS